MDRIKWLDGLRGISSILVYVHHFSLIFIPASYYGNTVKSVFSNNFDIYMSQSPFSFWLNGNFFVYIFILISCVISCIKMTKEDNIKNFIKLCVSRYFTLTIPIFFVSLITFFLLKIQIFTHLRVYPITESPWLLTLYSDPANINLFNLFYTSFIKVIFVGDDSFSTVFWMIKFLYFSVVISGVFGMMAKVLGEKIVLIYLFLLVALFQTPFFISILAAVLVYLIKNESIFNKNNSNLYIGISLILIGIFFGGYPTAYVRDGIYSYFPHINNTMDFDVYHAMGAFFLLLGLFMTPKITSKLTGKKVLRLGEISFEIYLIHVPILVTISTGLFLLLYNFFDKYLFAVTVTFVCSTYLVIIVSKLYKNNISKYANRLISYCLDFLFS